MCDDIEVILPHGENALVQCSTGLTITEEHGISDVYFYVITFNDIFHSIVFQKVNYRNDSKNRIGRKRRKIHVRQELLYSVSDSLCGSTGNNNMTSNSRDAGRSTKEFNSYSTWR
ncbi:hypothetical protein LOAG_09332 [Loa loa]|uniref:Uncharacterized protein n=1 Tax=Loa loa TaxID=7209 RepID=A0A1S0TSM8_LOALO|nr:hypothetical protein LOAG_09332 [Loa loa]EFO19162.1 hypothetical protein LOAG_09332 [Loa loa]